MVRNLKCLPVFSIETGINKTASKGEEDMKIAFAAAANSPHTIKWANTLTARGHNVSIITMPDHTTEHGEIHSSVEVKYLAVSESAGGTKKNAKELASLADGSDAVCAMDMATYGLMAAKAKLSNVLLISTGVDIYDMDKNGTKGAIKKSLKAASAVCSTAPNVITKIQETFKLDKQYFVTPFGVDMDAFQKKDIPRGEQLCVGSVKFLEAGNGVDAALGAFAKFVHKSQADAIFKIVGNGSQESTLRTRAQQLNIADRVEFVGYVKNADMPNVLNTMDMVVHLPPHECLGISSIEAMACELPIIATETNGSSEYILNGITGYLVKAGNTDACADRLAELASNPDARQKMGHMCREDVLPLYELGKCAEKFEEALSSVK